MANPTSISVEDARLYITLPALQVVDLVLKWAGMKADEGLALHPGPGHHHTEPFAIVGDQPDRYFVETAYTNRQVEEGRYTGALCVKARRYRHHRADRVGLRGPLPDAHDPAGIGLRRPCCRRASTTGVDGEKVTRQ